MTCSTCVYDPLTDSNGCRWEPYLDPLRFVVGFKVTKRDGSVRYLYLVPSDETDGDSNAFVYEGETGDPSRDQSPVYVDLPGTEPDLESVDPADHDTCEACGGVLDSGGSHAVGPCSAVDDAEPLDWPGRG